MTLRRARPLLGTIVEIEADGSSESHCYDAVDKAFSAVECVHRLMSFHESNSDLTNLNRYAYLRPVRVHPWTWRVLRVAKKIFLASDGLFDSAIGHELLEIGALPKDGLQQVVSGTFGNVKFLTNHYVQFTSPVVIDLGGIAKGYAVDRAIASLRSAGIRQAVVNAGGDIRVIGSKPTIIHKRITTHQGLVAVGDLQNGAIASSSSSPPRVGNLASGNLICTRTRRQLKERKTYSVIAPTCIVADALTKVLAQTNDPNHPIFAGFKAFALISSDGA